MLGIVGFVGYRFLGWGNVIGSEHSFNAAHVGATPDILATQALHISMIGEQRPIEAVVTMVAPLPTVTERSTLTPTVTKMPGRASPRIAVGASPVVVVSVTPFPSSTPWVVPSVSAGGGGGGIWYPSATPYPTYTEYPTYTPVPATFTPEFTVTPEYSISPPELLRVGRYYAPLVVRLALGLDGRKAEVNPYP